MTTSNPQYAALFQRSRPLALLWQLGQGICLLAVVATIGGPLGVLMIVAIDADVPWEHAVSAIEASIAWGLLLFVVSFASKRYALKKGGICDCH